MEKGSGTTAGILDRVCLDPVYSGVFTLDSISKIMLTHGLPAMCLCIL